MPNIIIMDFKQFKQRHQLAMGKVNEELNDMLPIQLEDLSRLLEKCRLSRFNYDILKKETP